MKKIGTYMLYLISILSLAYYSSRYYMNKRIEFDQNCVVGVTVIVFIIFLSLILGIVNCKKIDNISKQNIDISKQNVDIKKQNEELVDLLNKILERQDDVGDEILTTIQNSREISLDIYNKIKRGD